MNESMSWPRFAGETEAVICIEIISRVKNLENALMYADFADEIEDRVNAITLTPDATIEDVDEYLDGFETACKRHLEIVNGFDDREAIEELNKFELLYPRYLEALRHNLGADL